MAVKSTRLRWIMGRDPAYVSAAVSALPFKVEIKSIQHDGSAWLCWFVIPDSVPEFVNVEL